MKNIFVVLLFGFSFSLCAQNTSELEFASAVSQSNLQTMVRDLVKFAPRMGGTVRGDQSAEYLAQQFRDAGLQTEIVEDPELLSFEHDRWSLAVEEPSALREYIQNEWLAGYSPSVKLQRANLLSAELSQENAYGGSIVLTEKRISSELYNAYVKAGAVCILTYAPATQGKYTDAAFISSLRSVSDNPIPVFNLSYKNGAGLKSELQKGTPIVLSFMTETTIARRKPKTVVATLKGESDQYYIVCAHGDSDSGGPGADDNASGTAGVVEVARALQKLISTKSISPPKKTIKFIVWGSEIYSTGHFV
ncbi:MAG TPA: M28 family peptidase, partial [Bacteroidota bacterium]